jgi:hypothetical protein
MALGAIGDLEGRVAKLGDVASEEEEVGGEKKEGEEAHRITVVGNGPISRENYEKIQGSPEVWMFNDLKNFIDQDRLTTWIVRESGPQPGTVIGIPIFGELKADRRKYDYDYHVWKFKNKDLGRILVVGNTAIIPDGIRRTHPHKTKIDYAPVYERDTSKSKALMDQVLTFAGCTSYPHNLTGCGPSTGTVALDHLFNLRAAGEVPKSSWIHIYGMNWVFHENFLSCCNDNKNEKTGAESCCDDCHNFNREAEIIAKCCTAANRCKVYLCTLLT